ncbi:metal-dependent hydrolase [Salinisphaera sp. T31B1]|uniref:metal-dependent hydrolase n=1 Tax=Salinisphaera sp. T31B1 TaxID=727963 RepID=UPI003340A3B2
MTKFGHFVTSAGFSVLAYRLLAGDDPQLGILETLDWFAAAGASGDMSDPPLTGLAMACASGLIFGASAPDQMEFPLFGRLIGRVSLLPHRTVTHSPWLWIAFICGGVIALAQTQGWGLLFAYQWLGFSLSGALHIFVDMGSMSGIPLLNPFGGRYSLCLYSTGGVRELGYSLGIGIGAALLGWLL